MKINGKNFCLSGLIIMALFFSFSTTVVAKKQHKYELDFVIAHAPAKYFIDTAKRLRKEVAKATNGQLHINIIDRSRPDGDKSASEYQIVNDDILGNMMSNVQSGKVDMAQIYTSQLASLEPEFHVFYLPFLFENHEHFSRTAESVIGKYLLASLDNHGMVGLSYTYSGGYRVIVSRDKAIRGLDDLKGLKYRAASSAVNQETLSLLGVDFTVPEMERKNGTRVTLTEALSKGTVEAADGVYADTYNALFMGENRSKYLIETKHQLVTSTIVINRKKLLSLPPKIQTALREASVIAARSEREFVVRDGERIKKKALQDKDIEVIRWSAGEMKQMRKTLQPVYDKFSPIVGPNLIRRIQLQKESSPLLVGRR